MMSGRALVYTPTGFYTFDVNNPATTIVKANKVLIFNSDENKYEDLDPTKYRSLTPVAYIYKDRMYVDFAPVKEDINTANLKFVMQDGVRTNFVYDGKNLIYLETSGESGYYDKNNKSISLSRYMVANVDIATLHVISENMLIDKNWIYFIDTQMVGSTLQTIQIKELGFDVKIFAPAAELMK